MGSYRNSCSDNRGYNNTQSLIVVVVRSVRKLGSFTFIYIYCRNLRIHLYRGHMHRVVWSSTHCSTRLCFTSCNQLACPHTQHANSNVEYALTEVFMFYTFTKSHPHTLHTSIVVSWKGICLSTQVLRYWITAHNINSIAISVPILVNFKFWLCVFIANNTIYIGSKISS